MRRQRGFLLISVVLVLAVLAAMALMLSSSASLDNALVTKHGENAALDYLTEAGLRHARWRLRQNTSCSNYTDLPNTPFGDHSYTAIVRPANGSPVTMTVTATLNSGASRLRAETANVFLAPAPRVLQPGAELEDAYTWEGAHGGRNFGAAPILSVSNAVEKRTSLLRFDLSVIPAGASIESATLELFLEGGNSLSNGKIDVHRLSRAWVEGTFDDQSPPAGAGVTYQSFDGQTNWTNFGGDFDVMPIDSVTIPALTPGWYTWNVVSAVDAWVRGGVDNNGFLLRASGGTANQIEFASGDSATAARRPRLTITYTCECGATCTGSGVPGLLAHWQLDDTTGTTAIDSIGGHNGTLRNGPAWSAGQVEGALSFDGTNDFATAPHHDILSLTQAMTVSAWINLQSVGTDYRTILSKGDRGADSNYWFGVLAQELVFGFDAGGAFREVFTTGLSLQTGVWYHVAASFDNATDKVVLYVDGNDVTSNSLTQQPGAINAPVQIGRSSGGEFWHGALDDIRIYDQVLSAAGVAALHADGIPRVPLLFVVADVGSPTSEEAQRQALIETWGYAVTLIDDSDSQANFNSAVAINEVAYISEEIDPNKLDDKLRNAAIGVVNEERMLFAQLGFASAIGTQWGSTIRVTNNTHEITTGFGLGDLQITAWSQPLQFLQGTRSPDLLGLADHPLTPSPILVLLDAGDRLQGGGTAAGRRVWLPWGGDMFRFDILNADGQTIMQRAIAWAAAEVGGAACAGTFRDEFNAKSYANSDGTLPWATDWIENFDKNDGPTKGDERVRIDGGDTRLRVRNSDGGGEGVEREANLAGYASATISFNYRRDSLNNATDYVAFEVSNDGGSTWTEPELERFGGSNDTDYVSTSHNITAFISANTRIRFISSPTLGKKEQVYFDNVEICVKN